ncbi:MAG: FecCD family ABC transporter permease [Acidimicrobiales bacterium]
MLSGAGPAADAVDPLTARGERAGGVAAPRHRGGGAAGSGAGRVTAGRFGPRWRRQGRANPDRLTAGWLAAGFGAVLVATVVGVGVGPVAVSPWGIIRELLGLDSGLSGQQATIMWDLRLPRVVLGLMVGGVLSLAGGAYQATFRNPLADPYLLGVAGGAGFGATAVIVSSGPTGGWVPVGAFVGAVAAMTATYVLGAAGGRLGSSMSLLLAGVAVAAFFTAMQTYLQQRNQDDIRRVYAWILGRLSTSGWHEVLLLLPYATVAVVVLLAARRWLDVLSLGDDEAATLGANPRRIRLVVILAATLGTAAAVAVSGLIVFVGIIVPHTVRLVAGSSARRVLPLSVLFGAAFLALADLAARTVMAPAELPIGVLTAFLGAPFFVTVLRSGRNDAP